MSFLRQTVRLSGAVRQLSRTAPAYSVSGTAFERKELAEETLYIRAHEAKIREMKQKQKSELDLDRAEIERLADTTTRPHVKELLLDLAAHVQ